MDIPPRRLTRDIRTNITLQRRLQHELLDAVIPEVQSRHMARLSIRIDLGQDAALGPGKARLLEMINEIGSIRGAASQLGMSYRRAWLLVQDIEAVMGASVVAPETGGTHGGGTTLTDLGRAVVDQYRAIEKRASLSVATELRALSTLARTKSSASLSSKPTNNSGAKRKNQKAR